MQHKAVRSRGQGDTSTQPLRRCSGAYSFSENVNVNVLGASLHRIPLPRQPVCTTPCTLHSSHGQPSTGYFMQPSVRGSREHTAITRNTQIGNLELRQRGQHLHQGGWARSGHVVGSRHRLESHERAGLLREQGQSRWKAGMLLWASVQSLPLPSESIGRKCFIWRCSRWQQ